MLIEGDSVFSKGRTRQIILLLVIYIIANIPVLLNTDGIYWDDWTLYNHSLSTIESMFRAAAGPIGTIAAYIHYALLNYGNVYTYRILTLSLYFLSSLFLYEIFTELSPFSRKERFWLTLLFLIAPLFNSKFILINFPYTLFNTLFFFGCYLTTKWNFQLSVIKRFLIESIFFLSFIVNSHLVFYAIVLLYLFYQVYQSGGTLKENVKSYCYRYLDFILLPIIFFILKVIYFRPSGLYAGYNKISILNILNIKSYCYSFIDSFFKPILESSRDASFLYTIFIILIITFFFIKKKPLNLQQSHFQKNLPALVIGIGLFILGALPYIAVGKLPRSHFWFYSRFQLLLPLGFSVMLLSLTHIVFNKVLKMLILCIFSLSFIITNINEQTNWNLIWYFTLSIEKNFQRNSDIRQNTTFLVSHKSSFPYFQYRMRSVHAINGIARKALNEDSRLFIGSESEISYHKIACRDIYYNCSSWREQTPLLLEIEDLLSDEIHSSKIRYLKKFLELKYLERYNHGSFEREISNLVKLNIKK